jgi:Spy/CpxP family protein refolding chaperone
MKTFGAIKIVAVCAGFTWAPESFSQHSGHIQGNTHTNVQPVPYSSSQTTSHYSGEKNRSIKSLSSSYIAGLQSGAGMADAKAAELNGFPGSSHVLELASQLQLDGEQRRATQSQMDQHKARARELGAQLVGAERLLDTAFASKTVDAETVVALTQQIGVLQARLRTEHLQTHLSQTSLMTPQQISSYQSLRGYRSSSRKEKPSARN